MTHRSFSTIRDACATLLTKKKTTVEKITSDVLAVLKTHFCNLMERGAAGEVDIESELRALDRSSASITFAHKEKLYGAANSPFYKRLFTDFRYLSEELDRTIKSLQNSGVALAGKNPNGPTFSPDFFSQDLKPGS